MSLPNDAVMLLSVVNTLLRDRYNSLDELCTGEGADKEELEKKLKAIDYYYNIESNQFI